MIQFRQLFFDSGDTYNVVRDSHSQCHAFFQNVVQYHEGNRKRTMLENQIQQMHKEEFEERFEEMIREREMYSECFIEENSIKVQK